VLELEANVCTPAEAEGQRHFTVEDGNLIMACPHPCTGNTVVVSLAWRAEGSWWHLSQTIFLQESKQSGIDHSKREEPIYSCGQGF